MRLQTESDSLTAEIQAVYPKVNLGFPYNPKTVDLLQAGYEHDELTSAAIPQCELDETVGFLKSDAARSTVLNIPASRRFILAAAYSNNRRDLAETKARRDKFLKAKYPRAEAERRIRSLDLTKPLQFRPDPPEFDSREDKVAWSERDRTIADIIHKGPGEGGKQWVEKDLLENVGFLSNKGKGYSSHRNWTKTVITSVIGAALAEAQADPASNSLVQSQPKPLSPSDRTPKVPVTPTKPAVKTTSFPAETKAAAKTESPPSKTKSSAPASKPAVKTVSSPAEPKLAAEAKPAPSQDKSSAAASKSAAVAPLAAIKTRSAAVPAVETKPATATSKPAVEAKSAPAASKPAVETELVPDASKPAAVVDPSAASSKPAPTVSQPAAIASGVGPAAAEPTSHPAPTLPEVAVSLLTVNKLDTVEEESSETVLAEQPPAFAFDFEPLTEELDWGFESSPVAPKDSSQASGFLTAQSPLNLPAAAASSVATCLSPATALSAGAAVATGAVPVSAGISTVHTPAVSHPEIPLRVLGTWDETWDENNTIAQGWLDDFARKAGPSPSARPSP